MKTCKIHDLLRQLCLSKAHTENVMHVMNGNDLEAIDNQRRMILLSEVEEKYDYGPRNSSGIVRTFISMGVVALPKEMCSIVSEFKLLKVLDVLSVLWYDFSSVIPELVHLRYVSARIEEAPSLAKLRSLQTIILRRYFSGSVRPITLELQPLDIWRMSEIRHMDIDWPLYISNLVEAEQTLFLNNLQTLYLYNSPCVAEIIRRTPNLKKLKILYRSKLPDSLSILQDLETLHIKEQENIDPMIISRDISLPNLKKLKLFRTRIPWEVVNLLANLTNLEVLNGNRAFVGTDWKVDEDVVFHKLKYLRLYVCFDLERWELAAGSDNFPMLEQLKLYVLPKLEEIPESIGEIMTLKSIRIVDCSSGVNTSARKIQEEQESLGNYELQFEIVLVC